VTKRSGTKFGCFVAGTKGLGLLKGIINESPPSFIVSYQQNTSISQFDKIKKLSDNFKIPFYTRRDFSDALMNNVDVVFVAGWQFLISGHAEKLIVFHDSLLPKYRGFSPTVAALISGEKTIGVTALRPTAVVDAGPILAQMSIKIGYPAKIKDVYEKLSKLYAEIALKLISECPDGVSQDESSATYSLWRDSKDYIIDWSWDSSRVARFVDALGYPYDGARTKLASEEITIVDVLPVPDLPFVERWPGKVWSLEGGNPTIVCGKGMLKILRALDAHGNQVRFQKLRERLGH